MGRSREEMKFRRYDPPVDTLARNEAIVKARESGLTLRAIGKRFGCSVERVRQIIGKAKRLGRVTGGKLHVGRLPD